MSLTGPREVLPGTEVKMTAHAVDNIAVTAVTVDVDGANPSQYQAPPFERMVAVPPVAAPGSTIRVRAIARDARGNTGTAEATLTVVAIPDTEPPAVTVIAPQESAPGSTARVTAAATDNVGVASVEFFVGGVRVGTDNAPPYEAAFVVDAAAPIGSSIAVTARAVDFSDNRATAAASVLVVQAPDTTPPTVSLTAPATVVAGTRLLLSAEAADDAGVAGVTFVVDNVPIATLSQPPYQTEFTLPPGAEPGTLLAIDARAIDFAGLEAADAGQVLVTAAGEGLITGEVYDDTAGLPLAGATVSLSGLDSQGRA